MILLDFRAIHDIKVRNVLRLEDIITILDYNGSFGPDTKASTITEDDL